MRDFSILYTLLIGPLELLFETIYVLAIKLLRNPGASIIVLSFIMNMLLLPLYRRTDAIQEEAIATEKKLSPVVAHIKKVFTGDERFMILQTYYRQNHYKPTDALKGLSPLMLEIPFFMAAYHFLSGLQLLQGTGFGPIPDLGAPDGLLTVAGFSVNVLPVIMTVINLLSSMIYTKGAPVKTKVQLYGMAALFLILLYDSPAGLTFYWTLNNLFSLVKNILMKTRKPMLVLSWAATPLSILGVIFAVTRYAGRPDRILLLSLISLVVLNLPLAVYLFRRRAAADSQIREGKTCSSRWILFFLGTLVLSLLMGALIPSATIGASPEEFLTSYDMTPSTHVLYTALIFTGGFLIWGNVFYYLASPRWKSILDFVIWVICGIAVVDYMFFGNDYGTMNIFMYYDLDIQTEMGEILKNLCAAVLVLAAVSLLFKKKPEILVVAGIAFSIAVSGMAIRNVVHIEHAAEVKRAPMKALIEENDPVFQLSKSGKNVVILMMDMGIGGYVPYIFNEKPELVEQFRGFTYYPNTLSFGGHTNFGLPALFGGYEYTPVELNKRDGLIMEEKHNEALKLLPILFNQAGFRVTISDPTLAGYDGIPDMTIFDDYPEFHTTRTMGKFNSSMDIISQDDETIQKHNFVFYSIMKTAPVLLHETIYDRGNYFSQNMDPDNTGDSNQVEGVIMPHFVDAYTVLTNMANLTEILEEPVNTLTTMCNDTTHEPQLLQLPDYEFHGFVDNRAFDPECPVRIDAQGNELHLDTSYQITHYHSNMAAFIQLGHWMDYLKENDVYDNTRIIIAADHGYDMGTLPMFSGACGYKEDTSFFNPILMVKDFNSQEFQTDEALMTNADVPLLACSELISNPVNPFTGNPLVRMEPPYYVLASHELLHEQNNGHRFLGDHWLSVSEDIRDVNNWRYAGFGEFPEFQN